MAQQVSVFHESLQRKSPKEIHEVEQRRWSYFFFHFPLLQDNERLNAIVIVPLYHLPMCQYTDLRVSHCFEFAFFSFFLSSFRLFNSVKLATTLRNDLSEQFPSPLQSLCNSFNIQLHIYLLLQLPIVNCSIKKQNCTVE